MINTHSYGPYTHTDGVSEVFGNPRKASLPGSLQDFAIAEVNAKISNFSKNVKTAAFLAARNYKIKKKLCTYWVISALSLYTSGSEHGGGKK